PVYSGDGKAGVAGRVGNRVDMCGRRSDCLQAGDGIAAPAKVKIDAILLPTLVEWRVHIMGKHSADQFPSPGRRCHQQQERNCEESNSHLVRFFFRHSRNAGALCVDPRVAENARTSFFAFAPSPSGLLGGALMSEPSIKDMRAAQMFPTLGEAEIERLRRLGEARTFAAGEALATVGQTGLGLTIILSGHVAITQRLKNGQTDLIVTHGPGSFMGELAQLSGRPSLVDAQAVGAVTVLMIPPGQLRALLMAEAELGERIMRALILRRVGLIETGAGGPVIVGDTGSSDVMRLTNFLRRNGHPHVQLDPDRDEEAR